MADYPAQFFKDGKFNGLIVIGDDATDSIAAVDIATSITYAKRAEGQEIVMGTAKLAGEVANIAAQNTIIIGNPCENAAAAELMGLPTPCNKDFSAGKAVIKLYEHANGNVALLVAGYSVADTRRAVRVVANYAQWQDAGKLRGVEVEVTGTSFTDISVNAPTPDILTGCTEVLLKVAEIDGTPQICYGGSGAAGQINFTIENQGKKDIKEFGIVVGGTSGIYQLSNLNTATLIAGGAMFKNITYDYTTYGNIKYVRFVPKIEINGVVDVCSGSALQIESNQLRNCSAS